MSRISYICELKHKIIAETKQIEILNFIQNHAKCSSGDIHKEFGTSISYATVKRILTQLLTEKYIISEGKGKGTKYFISPSYVLLYSIDLDTYYEKEIDERLIKLPTPQADAVLTIPQLHIK